MANNRFKVDEGLIVSGSSNTEFYQEVNMYSNVRVVADLFLVTGNLHVQGNLLYTNTSISGDFAPEINGSDLGNTTNRFDLFSININASGNIVPSAAGLSIGNTTNRFDAFFRDLNVSGNSVLTNNTTIGGTGTINSTFYSGTSNIAFTANNADNFGGQPPSYYTNADNITTGTFPSNRLPQSTTTLGGIVILLDSISNTSISVYAPTANAVKTAYDAAIAANTRAASAQTEAAAAYSNAVAYVGTTSGNATALTNGTVPPARLPQATTTANGAVILLDSVSNTSVSIYAPTANAVKTAYDAAIAANTRAASAQTAATAAYSNAIAQISNATNLTSGTVSPSVLPQATTTANGAVVLLDSVSNTSISTYAPTANAVKTAYDAAIAANTRAAAAQTALNNITSVGVLNGLSVNGTINVSGNANITGTLNVDSGTLFVDSVNNRVGVNTTAPGYAVDIQSNDTTAGIGYGLRLRSNSTAAAAALQFTDSGVSKQNGFISVGDNGIMTILANGSSNYVTFNVGSGERLRINPTGANITGTLDVSGNLRSNNLLLQGDGTDGYIRPTNSGSKLFIGANNNNYVTIDPSGKVGVNLTNPDYSVDIQSTDTTTEIGYALRLRSNPTATAATIQFTDSAVNDQNGLIAVSDAGIMTLRADKAGSAIAFRTNGGERMRITNDGKILIGDGSTTNSYSVGYKEVPQRITTTTYDLVLSDAGKHIYNTNTTGTYAITVPNNFNVAYPIGAAISIVNGGNTITVAGGTNVTLRLAASTSTGTRTIANNGVATLIKVATDTWYISGAGVT